MDAAQPWLGLVFTAILNIAFAVVAGGVTSLWMLGRPVSAWSRFRWASTVAVLRAALIASLLAFALLLWTQAADLSELPLLDALASIGTVVSRTHVGHAWILGTSALALSIAVTLLHERGRAAGGIVGAASACAVIFAGAKSWMGHAGASGEFLPFIVDWAHLVAVSVWAGAVFLASVIVLRSPDGSGIAERGACAAYIEALSAAATWSLAGVLMTGALGAWHALHGSSAFLLTSTYGQVLLAKLVLVAIAVALGAQNRLVFMPVALQHLRMPESSSGSTRAFHRVLCFESFVLVGALCAAAVLSTSAPPNGP